MASRQQRKRWINADLNTIRECDWVWGNWIKNGYRKASEIDMGYPRIQTPYGDIFCVENRSPVSARAYKALITRTYKRSDEPLPLFVDRHVFSIIQEAEHGHIHSHL